MSNKKKLIFRILLVVSLIGNGYFLISAFFNWFNSPPDRYGRLTQSVEVGHFMDEKTIFTLPKGLEVKDASPQGIAAIDLFEPYRFSVTITTDNQDLIDYSTKSKKHSFGNIYSADINNRK